MAVHLTNSAPINWWNVRKYIMCKNVTMVNDTIANALDTIQCKVVTYDIHWNTRISLPVKMVEESESVFPIQKYDWHMIEEKIQEYVYCVVKEIKVRDCK